MSRFFPVPFALDGDTMTIPDAAQPDGSVSYTTGFGPDYQKQPGVPGYKFVPRAGHNVLFRDLTEAAREVQVHGYSDWNPAVGTSIGGYSVGAIVWLNGDSWRSQIDNNIVRPGDDATSWWPSARYMVSYDVAADLASSVRGAIYVNASRIIVPATYLVDTTLSSSIVLTLPASLTIGDSWTFIDPNNTWGAKNWSLELNGKTIESFAGPLTVDVSNQQFSIYYNGVRVEFF